MLKPKSSGFVYKKRDPKKLKEHAEQSGGRFDSYTKSGFDVYRPQAGANRFRILPPTWDDHDHYAYQIWLHKYIGADSSTYLCPNKMLGKPCAVCRAAKEAKDAGEEDEAKALQVTNAYLAWVLDREEDSVEPALYTLSWTIDKELAALCEDPKTKKTLWIDHPDEGYDVSFKRTGTGVKTKYTAWQIDREPSPIADDSNDQEEILQFISDNPIPTVLNYFDNEYLKKVLEGSAEETDELDDETVDEELEETVEEAEEEEPPPRRTSTKKPAAKPTRRRPEPEEEEPEEAAEEEYEEEPAEEEAEEPPPRRKPGSKPVRRVARREPVEEEGEELVEEEEAEEPPPRRTSKKPTKPVRRVARRPEPAEEEEEESAEEEYEDETAEEESAEEEYEEVEEEPEEEEPPPRRKPTKPVRRR